MSTDNSFTANHLGSPNRAFCGVVLAGGRSSRMGQDKALLKLENETLLARAQRILHEAGAKKVLVSGATREQGIADYFDEVGPLGGIHAVLRKTSLDIIAIPVDMPLLTFDMIKRLVPTFEHPVQDVAITYRRFPIPAFIPNNSRTLQYIEMVLNNAEGDWSIRGLLKHIGHQEIEAAYPQALSNVNTPEEWQELRMSLQVD